MGEQHDIDPARADEYVGKVILVGVTYVDRDRTVVGQIQWHGTIEAVEPLLQIRVSGSEEVRTLPPQAENATPGEYKLRTTGEVVTDPDFLATWTVEG